MRTLVWVAGLTLTVLCGLLCRPAAADDAQVRYVITNGGVDVAGNGGLHYFRAGKHDEVAAGAHSGETVTLPAGSYDVQVNFDDGDAHKELWIDNQAFSGTVEKTVEIALPIADVRYVVTNNGADTADNGSLHFYQAGRHDSVVSGAHSGQSVRIPAGSYDVQVNFDVGDAHKEMWFDGVTFAGSVDKTVEIALPLTDVRYVITNNGEDAHDKGQVHYYRAGRHDDVVSWSNSGGSVRMAAGSYDVQVTFNDGDAHKEQWIENQAFSGHVDRTVEVGVNVAEVRYVITNNGTDTGDKGQVHYYRAGNHDSVVSWSNSGGSTRIPAGNYDVQITFNDGDAHKEQWIENQAFSGHVDRTVEVGADVAEVRYVITNNGTDTGDKGQVHFYAAGRHDSVVSWFSSGGTARLPAGSYDAQVTFVDGLARKEIWLDNQAYSGKVDKTLELGIALAHPTVTVTRNGTDAGSAARVRYFVPGTDKDIGEVGNDEATVVEAGRYDVRGYLDAAEGWLRNVAIADTPHLTVEMQQPRTQVMVTATRGGNPLAGAWCGLYAPGRTDGAPIGRADSGAWLDAAPGTYDVGCTIVDDGVTEHGWLANQELAVGRTALAIELPAQCVVPAAIELPAPAGTPEKLAADRGDFPYLAPLPGSHPTGSRADASAVYVLLPDAHQPELVANGSIIKTYQAPKCVSPAALMGLYRDALPKAGWTIVSDPHQGDAGLTAHYGQNNRNIWAAARANAAGYMLAVADATVTAGTLAADLNAKCHLALTGVLFDFDKSSLKPESDGVLLQVGFMMAADPGLRLDVQGHTDNVGTDAYNQRLSEARAASVVTWLTQHRIAADRLAAHGFGKTRPIASNDTEEGRARNRRVEIANPACAH